MEQERKDILYDELYRLIHQSKGGKQFRLALEAALQEGYPIDYGGAIGKGYYLPLFCELLADYNTYKLDTEEEKAEYLNSVRYMLNRVNLNALDSKNWNVLMYASHSRVIFLPNDIYAEIVAKTKNLETSSLSYKKFYPRTALNILAARYLWGGFNSTEKATCWEKIKILMDAGAKTEVLENMKEEVEQREQYYPGAENDYKAFIRAIEVHKEQQTQLKRPNSALLGEWDYELSL